MGHIFISYSHKDKAYVEKLEKKLIDEGFDVWVDHRIDYGDDWLRVIEKNLDTSDAFIIVMSDNSRASDMVQNEITRARDNGKPIFPVLLEGGHWLAVQRKQYADVRDGSLPPEKFYYRLEAVMPRNKESVSIDELSNGISAPVWRKRKLKSFWGIGVIILGGLLFWGGYFLKNNLAFDRPPLNSQLGDTWARPTDGMVMSYIPAGELEMGSEDGEDDEKPVHIVYLDAFWMDQTEVTNSMFVQCVKKGYCNPPWGEYWDDERYINHPVVFVEWEDANSYCDWSGARLPTEAEWEKAARSVDGRIYPWGDEFDCNKANMNRCVGFSTTVGSYKVDRSPYGLYDMGGNVFEWVADWYDEGYYENSPL